MRKIIQFTSEFDGSVRQAVLRGPDDTGGEARPLIIVPHAAGFSAEATAAYWRGIPEQHGVFAVFPFGHSRELELFSLGWRGQIEDLASLPRILGGMGYPVDTSRVYAVGISMGGTESLLLAGKHPGLLSGVVTFNALIDLNAWYHECDETIREQMTFEVGGTPEQVPEAYFERSPINYTANIARVSVLLYWDPNDEIVRSQTEKQSGLLYRRIKDEHPNARIEARQHHFGHFYVRPAKALDWLLGTEQAGEH